MPLTDIGLLPTATGAAAGVQAIKEKGKMAARAMNKLRIKQILHNYRRAVISPGYGKIP
jgi:hypothetical protein